MRSSLGSQEDSQDDTVDSHDLITSVTPLFRRHSTPVNGRRQDIQMDITAAIYVDEASGHQRPVSNSTVILSILNPASNQEIKRSVSQASEMPSQPGTPRPRGLRTMSSMQILNSLIEDLATPHVSNQIGKKTYTNDFTYADYQRCRGYLPNNTGGKLDQHQFENIKAAVVPFNKERFIVIINEAEPTDEARDMRRVLREQAATSSIQAPPSASHFDCSYAEYVRRGGYLPDGSGGRISERRFAQLKTEVQPFSPERFVALVNSMERLRIHLGTPQGQEAPEALTDAQLLRQLLARQSNNSHRLANVEGQLYTVHQMQQQAEERYAEVAEKQQNVVTAGAWNQMMDVVGRDTVKVLTAFHGVATEIEKLRARVAELEGAKEGAKENREG